MAESTTLNKSVYDAFIKAGVGEELASQAAKSVVSDDLSEIKSDIKVLSSNIKLLTWITAIITIPTFLGVALIVIQNIL